MVRARVEVPTENSADVELAESVIDDVLSPVPKFWIDFPVLLQELVRLKG